MMEYPIEWYCSMYIFIYSYICQAVMFYNINGYNDNKMYNTFYSARPVIFSFPGVFWVK